MTTELFHFPANLDSHGNPKLEQYFTPEWTAAMLVEKFFPDLSAKDYVVDPGCGRGAFLKAIPGHVPAIGIEIDERLADYAANDTGRQVIVGNFRNITVPEQPTVIIGNPPFSYGLIESFMERSKQLLPTNGRVGMILPAHSLQTPSRTLRWNEDWSMNCTLLPRTIWPRLRVPVVFVTFVKDRLRIMQGFALYREIEDISGFAKWSRLLLTNGKPKKPTWRALVEETLVRLGGRASLDEIYSAIEPRRPASNNWWKEKVRQTLLHYHTRIEKGVWAV